MAGRPIRIAILANGRQARAEIKQTSSTLGTLGSTASKAGKLLAAGFAVDRLARAGAAFVRSGAGYVTSLNKIQALTGSTTAQMKQAASVLEANSSRYAKMGQTTSDAAAGVVELAKSGLSLHKSLKAVNATMTLAKAGEMDVADASTVVSNTLNTFHLRASRAADIANVLANAANISSADVSDLAESLKFIAPVAAKSHMSLAQTAALMAELANNGIKGSQAGTSLRQMLLRLQAPSGAAADWLDRLGVQIHDSSGKMKPFSKVLGQLRTKLDGLTEAKRTQALKDIFGVRTITAAQVVLDGGVKTLAEYTDGVKQAGAAQKLANAQSKGLMGTLDKIKASAVSAGQSFYRKYSPAVDDALKSTIDFAGRAKDAFDAIPGQVKSIVLEVGIAALAWPRLTAALAASRTAIASQITYLRVLRLELAETATRSQALAAGLARMGRMARTAAGIAGMAALVDSAHRSSGAVKTLETTLGAAAAGFSVGGPWGAAVGAAVGGIYSIVKSSKAASAAIDKQNAAMKRSDAAMDGSKPHLVDYANTLDKVTGAATRATRAAVLQKLQQDHILAQAAPLGLSARTLVNATLGQVSAVKRVNNAWRRHRDLLSITSASHVQAWIENQNRAFEDQRDKIQDDAAAVRHYSRDVLAKLPPKVRTEVKTNGIKPSVAAIARLVKRYKIVDGKTIRALIKLSGAKTSVKQVKGVAASLRDVGKVRPNMKGWLGALTSAYGVADKTSKRGSDKVGKSLSSAGKVKLDGEWVKSLMGALGQAKSRASSGGHQVGASLKASTSAGFNGIAGLLSSAMRGAVNGAIAAGLAAARSHHSGGSGGGSGAGRASAVGRRLGDGIIDGLISRRRAAAQEGRTLVQQLFKAAGRGFSDVSAALTKYLDKHTKLRDKQIDKLLKKHKKQIKNLVAEARAVDKVTKKYKGQNYTLEKAQQLLKSRLSAYRAFVASVKSSIIGSADLTQMSIPFTPEGIVSGLQNAVAKAKQYAKLLNQLKKAHLNKTTLKQLTDAGVQGGLATAQALAQGIGKGTIAQVNQLMGQLTGKSGVGQQLGQSIGNYMDRAGIKAAQALVRGLKKKQRKLEKQFEHLADALINRLLGKKTFAQAGKGGGGRPRINAKQVVIAGPTRQEPLKVTLHLSAHELSQLQRGRQIHADLRAYERATGKKKAA